MLIGVVIFYCEFIFIFIMINYIEYPLMCLFAIYRALVKCLFMNFPIFQLDSLLFTLQFWELFLWSRSKSVKCVSNNLFHYAAYLCILFTESFVEFLIFTMPILSLFPSYLFYFGAYPKCSSTICWKTILELLLHLCQRSIVWSIYGFSSLFHWSLCLPLCQYHTPLIAVAI